MERIVKGKNGRDIKIRVKDDADQETPGGEGHVGLGHDYVPIEDWIAVRDAVDAMLEERARLKPLRSPFEKR